MRMAHTQVAPRAACARGSPWYTAPHAQQHHVRRMTASAQVRGSRPQALAQAATSARRQLVLDNMDSAAPDGGTAPVTEQWAQPASAAATTTEPPSERSDPSSSSPAQAAPSSWDDAAYDATEALPSSNRSNAGGAMDEGAYGTGSDGRWATSASAWEDMPASSDRDSSSNGARNSGSNGSNGTNGSSTSTSSAGGWEADWGQYQALPDWGEQWEQSADDARYTYPGASGNGQYAAGMGYNGGATAQDAAWQQQQPQQQQEWEQRWVDDPASSSGRNGRSSMGQQAGAALQPSDITILLPKDAEAVLPLLPSIVQSQYYSPKTVPERVVQVMGSIGVCVAMSKTAGLAAPALLYPVWGPWIRAGARNLELYSKHFRGLGVWRAQVLQLDITRIPYAYSRASYDKAVDSITITVGDPWDDGARAQVTFPYLPGAEDIMVGEPAELLVFSADTSFRQFKVVHEVYLPQTGLWLSEYPFINRNVFLDISLAIERNRQAEVMDTVADPLVY